MGRKDTEKRSPAAIGSLITHIHGAWYDLTPWRNLHPGGPFALDLAAGRDGTVLYEQSHPFSSKAMLLALLEPLRVAPELAPALYARYPHVIAEAACFSFSSAPASGKPSGGSSSSSSSSSTAVGASHDDAFEVEVKRLAHDYFQKEAMRRGVSIRAATKAPPERWAGCLALGLAFVFLGALPLVRGEWLALLIAPVLLWLFMVNYWHDASHFAMSTDWRVNWALQYLAPWFSSPLVWSHQHIIGHHAYTNVQGRDPDLYHAPSLWRFSEDVRWRPSHGWQVWSTLFLWTLSVPTLLLLKPLAMLKSKTLNRAVPLMQLSFARIVLHLLGRLRESCTHCTAHAACMPVPPRTHTLKTRPLPPPPLLPIFFFFSCALLPLRLALPCFPRRKGNTLCRGSHFHLLPLVYDLQPGEPSLGGNERRGGPCILRHCQWLQQHPPH